jgi:hypothetical protein
VSSRRISFVGVSRWKRHNTSARNPFLRISGQQGRYRRLRPRQRRDPREPAEFLALFLGSDQQERTTNLDIGSQLLPLSMTLDVRIQKETNRTPILHKHLSFFPNRRSFPLGLRHCLSLIQSCRTRQDLNLQAQ